MRASTFLSRVLFTPLLVLVTSLYGDVNSRSGTLNFSVIKNGPNELVLNSTGLGIGTTPSTNLNVIGSGEFTKKISVGTTSTQANLNIGGIVGQNYLSISDNVSYVGDPLEYSLIYADTSLGDIRIDLPLPLNADTQKITIKKTSASNNVIITGSGGKIDNSYYWKSTASSMSRVTVHSNSSSWYILESDSIENYTYTGNFIMTVNTSIVDETAANFFTLPLLAAGKSATINWGDGNSETHTDDTDIVHNYGTGAIFTIEIAGTFSQLKFSGSNDCKKVVEIQQWGPNAWSDMMFAFYGCSNMNITAKDSPDTSSATSFFTSFRDCSSIINFPYMDTSSSASFNRCWMNCTSIVSFPILDFSSATDLTNFLQSTNISTYVWSHILINTEANNPNNNLSYVTVGSSTQHTAAGNVAFAALSARGWQITDGGQE